jgi:3-methyl-2-oxobutanoate hydroxymethyltransferase
MKPVNTVKLLRMKAEGQKIVMITAYDYPGAKLVDRAGVDLILVGDSLGMVVLGYENTLAVTLDDMIHHSKAVMRGRQNAMVVVDMPFMSYQVSPEQALINAGRLVQEGGAQAVKLEGGTDLAGTVAKITGAGIPVFGHLGFTPQSVYKFGGAFVQGKTASQAVRLVEDALRLEDAGICGLVLELVPWEVAAAITQRLTIPTIGIGSGAACDGQVLVYHDLLGFDQDFQPRHSKIYAPAGETIRTAVQNYCSEVREGKFPTEQNAKRMGPDEYRLLVEQLPPVVSKGEASK